MDDGLGKFIPISKKLAELFYENIPNLHKSRVFTIGEVVEIKGSKFKVEKIKKRTLRLLLLPDVE